MGGVPPVAKKPQTAKKAKSYYTGAPRPKNTDLAEDKGAATEF